MEDNFVGFFDVFDYVVEVFYVVGIFGFFFDFKVEKVFVFKGKFYFDFVGFVFGFYCEFVFFCYEFDGVVDEGSVFYVFFENFIEEDYFSCEWEFGKF